MITHTVVFKTKHPKGSSEEKEFIEVGIALGNLPMVQNFECYEQVGRKNDFDFGFSMEFSSQLEYDAYNAHPKHTEFVKSRWEREVDKFLEIDYVKYHR